MSIRNIAIVGIGAVIFLAILWLFYHFFIQPFSSASLYTSAIVSKLDITGLRSYYIIVGSISGTFTALSGVVLGLFYYFHKQKVDREQLMQVKKSRLVETLLAEINEYDALVDKILNKEFQGQSELQMLRGKIRRKFEMVYLMIEEKNHVLGFSKNAQIELFDVNKYVDDSHIIMESGHNEIDMLDLDECRAKFIDKIISSRRVCLGGLA